MSRTASVKAAKTAGRLPLAEDIVRPTFRRERRALAKGIWPVAGCDEAGRGPLAGPVVAAAVILDPDRIPRGLNDSKKLDMVEREKLYARICATAEVAVAFGSTDRIDRDNILRASLWALARAVKALPVRPKLVFVDGRDRIDCGCDCEAVISGDALVTSIAAASIVAKVTRDRLMMRMGLAHPGYGFERHMGYSVPEHFRALNRLGPTIHHRRSFAPVAAFYGETVVELSVTDTVLPLRMSELITGSSARVGSRDGDFAARIQTARMDGGLGAMNTMSLFVELLRTRPRLLFWTMALLQAVLWTLVPALFYAAPPGQLPLVLAIGHEFQGGTEFGPPLAFWLAEIAYRLAGMTGVYLLSQLCVVATFGIVLALGRAIVGTSYAVIAVMLMAGIAVFSVPTTEFGPAIVATPLWALMLLHYWTATQRKHWIYWVVLGVEAGLLLLTTYAGIILVGLLVVYTLTTALGRAQLENVGPWIAGIAMTAVLFPYLIWLDLSAGISLLDLATIAGNLRTWGWLIVAVLLSHIGMLVLIVLGRGARIGPRGTAPEIFRASIHPGSRSFVYFFALAPILAMGLFALFTHRPENFLLPPLVVMSGLAVMVAAGDRIRIEHQYLIGYAWIALIVVPPILVALAIAIQPWTYAEDLRVGRPAVEMGQFFGDSFARRTGRPLAVVAGDQTLAPLVALSAPSRPSLYVGAASSVRVTKQDIAEKGAVIVWPATDTAGRPPPDIQRQFPDLVIEVPRAFDRQFQGRMPLMRVGWGVVRPRAQATGSSR